VADQIQCIVLVFKSHLVIPINTDKIMNHFRLIEIRHNQESRQLTNDEGLLVTSQWTPVEIIVEIVNTSTWKFDELQDNEKVCDANAVPTDKLFDLLQFGKIEFEDDYKTF